MITPVTQPLSAYRWQPYRETQPVIGADFNGAGLTMQVRAYPDASGPPLINLSNSLAPSEGLSVAVVVEGLIPTSTISIRIDEGTLQDLLPLSSSGLEPGVSLVLNYDLVVEKEGFGKFRLLTGPFILVPGSNQA